MSHTDAHTKYNVKLSDVFFLIKYDRAAAIKKHEIKYPEQTNKKGGD